MTTTKDKTYPTPPIISLDTPPRSPQLSAYEDGPDGFRIKRLQLTWEAIARASTLFDGRDKTLFSGAIRAFRDHKGFLEVIWRDPASKRSFEHLTINAWSLHGEGNLRHECLLLSPA